ncbi:MAG TPA: phage major capsid protein [Thermomicrobiales bacterium]|nr:phage major capsid protein [Thermomicrobiales bacterium]
MPSTEDLLKDISDRMTAIDTKADAATNAVSEENLRKFVEDYFGALDDNDPLVRKMRFQTGEGEDKLKGSKYGRFGLGVSDIEWLHDLKSAQKESGRGGGPSDELTRMFNSLSPAVRANDAMDTQESGYGQQLIGAQYVGDLWTAARPESRVFGLINTFEMTAPTAYLPVEVDIPEMIMVSESTASNSSAYPTQNTGSNRVQVDAKKFAIHQMWSADIEEDSIIPFVPFLRRQAAISLAHYADSLVLNGDTTATATGNINLDDDTPASNKHFLAFDGLRHVGLVDNTGNSAGTLVGSSLGLGDLMAVKGRMVDYTYLHDWGHPTDATSLVYIADPATADLIASIDKIRDARIYNGGTDLLSGEVARILGHPVISSIAVPKTEADGKASKTGANNVKGQIVTINRRGFVAGWRRHVKMATEFLPATDQQRIVYTLRLGFGRFTPSGSASGIKSADVIYNIGL